MDYLPEISFHGLQPSEEFEALILARVDKLARLYDRLIGMRVTVEARQRQHRTGNVYEVHVEMRVPKGPLVVSREPHHPKENYAAPDAHTSLRDAFDAAEAVLKAHKEQMSPQVRRHVRG